jgi:hypothetical protein
LDPYKHSITEEEFLVMEKAGICSNSPWASPLHLVPKKDSSWRPCSDYRHLNAVTIPDRYSLPNMQSLNDRMAGSRLQRFSKTDLVKAYHQIPIAEEDILSAYGNSSSWRLVRMGRWCRPVSPAAQRVPGGIL